jgi:hypothetical protein
VTEPSFAAIENLMFGHRAYLGMNPEIEKITQEEEQVTPGHSGLDYINIW